MQCSFEEKITYPDGGFSHSKCVNDAEILLVNDPCYGLCFRCAYQKLQATATITTQAKRIEGLELEYERHERLLKFANQDSCNIDCDLPPYSRECPEHIAKRVLNECGEIVDNALREIDQVLKEK